MKEDIREYYMKFAVDTIHTEAIVKAYSESDAESLLKNSTPTASFQFLK